MNVAHPAPRNAARAFGAIALGLLLLACTSPLFAEDYTEAEVKAAFVIQFTRFVEWPSGDERDADDERAVCFLRSDPVGVELAAVIGGSPERGLRAVELRSDDDPTDCDVLFIGESAYRYLENWNADIGGRPILTVSDLGSGADRVGIINFLMQSGRVRFEVDPKAARRAKLKISAKLMRLASIRREDAGRKE